MTRQQAHKLWDAITNFMSEIGIADHAVVISDSRPNEADGDCDMQIVPKSVEAITFDWTQGPRNQ